MGRLLCRQPALQFHLSVRGLPGPGRRGAAVCHRRAGVARFDGQGWWPGQATCVRSRCGWRSRTRRGSCRQGRCSAGCRCTRRCRPRSRGCLGSVVSMMDILPGAAPARSRVSVKAGQAQAYPWPACYGVGGMWMQRPPPLVDRPHARLDRASAVLVVVVGRLLVVVGTLTGPLGRPSTAWLTVVPTATGPSTQLLPAVRQREPGPGRKRGVVGAEVGEERLPT